MNPEQFLSNIMVGLWEWMKVNEYIYFVIAIIVIVLVGKLIKASLKAVVKIAGAIIVLYFAWELLQFVMEAF